MSGLNGLTLAVPRGALMRDTLDLLDRLGVDTAEVRANDRRLLFEDAGIVTMRPSDVATYVEAGAADLGITGKDVLAEHSERAVYELLDLGFGPCVMVVATTAGEDRLAEALRRLGVMRVATKYPRIAARHFERTGRQAEIVEVKGSVELAPLTGLAEGIVDLTATGHDAARERARRARGDPRLDRAADREPGRAQAQGGGARRPRRADAGGAARWLSGSPSRTGDAASIAAHVRGYVPAAASVADRVAGIIESVREGGDHALLEHERRFGGGEGPLRVPDDELRAALDGARPGGPRRAGARARERRSGSREAGLGEDRERRAAAGPADPPARAAGRARRRLRPRRPAAVSVLGDHGRRRRRAPPACPRSWSPRPAHPVILAACALCGADEVYRMGGAQAIAALALRDGDDPARRRDRRPGQPVRPGGQAPGLGPRRDRRLRRPLGPARARLRRRRPAPDRARPARAGRARRGLARRRGLRRRGAARRRRARRAGALPRPPDGRRRPEGAGRRRRPRRGARVLGGARARAPAAVGEAAEALAPRVRRAGCLFVGAASAHGVRRLRRGLEPHAADRRRGALRVRARASRTSAAAWPRSTSAARPARSPARACRSPRPRASPSTRSRCPPGSARIGDRMSRSAQLSRKTGETDVQVSLDLDGNLPGKMDTGVGFFDHMLDLLARHGRIGLGVTVQGDLETGSHHTVEDTGIVLGQALDQALGDRRGIRRYGHAVVPMDEARAACAIDVSGRPYCAVERARAAARHDRRLRARGRRGVLPRRRERRAADAARRAAGGHERAPHDRGLLQGVRPRAADRGLDRPRRDRRALDQGDADVTVALVDYGMGNRRSVEKALEHVGARVARTARPRRDRRRRRDRAARRRRVPGGDAAARRARPRRADPRAGRARACRCSGSASACSCCSTSLRRARGRRRPGPAAGHGHAAARARAEGPAHRLEHGHVHAPVGAHRGARRGRGLLPRAHVRLPAARRSPTSSVAASTASASSRSSSAAT